MHVCLIKNNGSDNELERPNEKKKNLTETPCVQVRQKN